MLRNSRNKGITLIALVVTIIVLLILAGISITMLSGNNGLLKRSGEAKDLTKISQEKENITLAYNSALIDKMQKESNAITLDEFDKAIKSYDNKASTSSEGSKIIVTFSNGHKYTVYKNGTVSEYTEPAYAKDVLTVTVSENSIESPYYVNYPSSKGAIKCRVLYNDDTYGLQIISVNPVTKITLGSKDTNDNVIGATNSVEKAKNSYNRAITTLNEKAEEYIRTNNNSIIATDARCVGSNPLNKNHPENLTGDEKKTEIHSITEEFNNNQIAEYYKTDTHYELDYNRLDKIGIKTITDDSAIDKTYWLASRYSIYDSSYNADIFDIRSIDANGSDERYPLLSVYHSNRFAMQTYGEKGLRVIFKLSPNAKVIDGEGTEKVPFEIEL